MNHDEYWRMVKEDAERQLRSHLPHGERGDRTLRRITGDDNGIVDADDVRGVLAHVMRCGTCEDAARAVLSATDWRTACHELAEHGQAGVWPRQTETQSPNGGKEGAT